MVAIDAKKCDDGHYTVVINGGRIDMGIDAVEWAKKAEELGAGEILLTSMDTDGVKGGFDLDMLNAVCSVVKIPVIASGGCGKLEHFTEVFEKTNASAALAASLFHYKELEIREVKEETGLDISALEPCGIVHWAAESGERYLEFLFRTKVYSGELCKPTHEGRCFWTSREALQSAPNLSMNFKYYLPMFFDDKYAELFFEWDGKAWDGIPQYK